MTNGGEPHKSTNKQSTTDSQNGSINTKRDVAIPEVEKKSPEKK
jgi:hypothetical protein